MPSAATLLVTVAAGCAGVALALAPAAAATPECTTTAPNTTQCETNGSTQIVTSPPTFNNFPWFGYPFGGFLVGVGI
ncbi:MAG: hypothetical protein JST91_06185 [Actinobacteria bacterium]|nr:hypothetical protein [Actinomycetota bacterium]